MKAIVSNVKLHLNLREYTFVIPLTITGMVAVISVLISFIFMRSGSLPGTEGWIQGSQSNPGIIYALAGFFIANGVMSVSTSFPFALALGSTRRAFVTGTLLWNAFTAAYIAAILAILAAVEVATGHWFSGFYIFDVNVLGAGDTGRLLTIVFLGTLTALTIGGVFGAAWTRFGARGPQLTAVGVVVVLASAAIVIVPEAARISAAFEMWWLAAAAGVIILLAAVGSWMLLRSAIVR